MKAKISTKSVARKKKAVHLRPLSLSQVRTQLKAIGLKVESIARNLEVQNTKIDCEGLFEVGEKIAHFLDNLESEKLIGKINEPKILPRKARSSLRH